MKKAFYIICLFALTTIVSCDKINSDEYVIFAGVFGEWSDGAGVVDKSQRVFLEKYTGPKCPNCPDADAIIHEVMEKYGNQLLAISIHDSSFFGLPLGDVDLRTEDGNTWSKFFGIDRYPRSIINRNKTNNTWETFAPTSSFDDKIDNVLSQEAILAIGINATNINDNIEIKVDIEHLKTINEAITLTLLIVEDSIIAPQSMPDHSTNQEYVHNHILRDVITDIWGADVESSGTAGVKRSAIFKYSPTNVQNIDNCQIIGFVSYKESRQIINAAGCSI